MQIIDLSAPIVSSTQGTPTRQQVSVEYEDHHAGAATIERLYGVPASLLRDGEGWASELVTLGTHSTTHVDAPYHYNSSVRGRPAQTIDALPLEQFFAPGVVLDFSDREDGDRIGVADLAAALLDAGHELEPGHIVLIRSDCDRFYGQADYGEHGPGVSADATRWLYARGVKVMGIDAWGWDRPLSLQAAETLDAMAPGIFWEAHQVDLAYSQIERLCNLAALPPSGFTVACFPLRIVGASAAPARVVAILP